MLLLSWDRELSAFGALETLRPRVVYSFHGERAGIVKDLSEN